MPPDHRQAQAIAHVFVNYLSVRDAEDPFARAVLAEMVLAKIFDFDGIVIDRKDVDATPLIGGATLAMQALLKAYEEPASRTTTRSSPGVTASRATADPRPQPNSPRPALSEQRPRVVCLHLCERRNGGPSAHRARS